MAENLLDKFLNFLIFGSKSCRFCQGQLLEYLIAGSSYFSFLKFTKSFAKKDEIELLLRKLDVGPVSQNEKKNHGFSFYGISISISINIFCEN